MSNNQLTSGNYQPRLRPVNSWEELQTNMIAINSGNQTPIGESNMSGSNFHLTLFDVPRSPLLSITELRHANTGIISQQPAYMVGESWASPFIPQTAIIYLNKSSGWQRHRSMIDWNYLMNDALYDGFFFSGIAPDGSRPMIDGVLSDFVDGTEPLLNTRMRLIGGRGDALADSIADSSESERLTPEAYRRSAEHLWIDGAFNVNSTSVEAWAALLGGLNRIEVESSDGTTDSDVDFPFSRMRTPNGSGE